MLEAQERTNKKTGPGKESYVAEATTGQLKETNKHIAGHWRGALSDF
jgi:hypothetical protein